MKKFLQDSIHNHIFWEGHCKTSLSELEKTVYENPNMNFYITNHMGSEVKLSVNVDYMNDLCDLVDRYGNIHIGFELNTFLYPKELDILPTFFSDTQFNLYGIHSMYNIFKHSPLEYIKVMDKEIRHIHKLNPRLALCHPNREVNSPIYNSFILEISQELNIPIEINRSHVSDLMYDYTIIGQAIKRGYKTLFIGNDSHSQNELTGQYIIYDKCKTFCPTIDKNLISITEWLNSLK